MNVICLKQFSFLCTYLFALNFFLSHLEYFCSIQKISLFHVKNNKHLNVLLTVRRKYNFYFLLQVYQSLVDKRLEAGEDPYPITFCKRVPSKVYEKEKVSGVQAAMLDLLEHIVSDTKMGSREKRKKLKRFKTAYPEIFTEKFPTPQDEPEILRNNGFSSMSSLSKLKNVMRI